MSVAILGASNMASWENQGKSQYKWDASGGHGKFGDFGSQNVGVQPPKVITSGWWYTYPSEKYEFVSWDDDIPNFWKNKKCSKPPNRRCVVGNVIFS